MTPQKSGFLPRHDEAHGVSARREEHRPARLVRLRLHGAADVVLEALLLNVVRHVVEPFGEPVVATLEVASGIALEPVARHPVDVVLRAEERADAERALHLLRRERADLRVGVAETALTEHRVSVERADRGVHLHARLAEDLADRNELRVGGALRIEIVLGMLRVPRNEVVVVVARHLDEPLRLGVRDDLRDLKRIKLRLHGTAERVPERVSDAPERHRTGVDTQFVVHEFLLVVA